MAQVRCGEKQVALQEGETVLSGLERAGVPVASSCRAGACQTCLVRAVHGPAPASAQRGLKEALRAQGYFLSCVATPEADVEIATDAGGLEVDAEIAEVERLAGDVLRVRLTAGGPFEYRAGQFITLVRADGLARSYSLASVPGEDDSLELHVRHLEHGAMSGWLAGEARRGTRVRVRGPFGDCFYVPGRPDQPLLLAGVGTGLAPLLGVVRDALRSGHTGPMTLFHGAVEARRLYLQDELRALADRHSNLVYRPVVLRGEPREGLTIGALDAAILSEGRSPKGSSVFLCGDPELVVSLRRKIFLAGASSADIHVDAFLPSRPAAAPPST